ncbi:LysR family transcriptional regulator [Paenirhodobacter sp.]|uniref:LysR family transcriptional regulator n=1 Tax=Paenirhodobacter sp. TaxID=1965326 RepID=UPI003B3E885D
MRLHAASLYYFDAVRRAGSIRAAARRLNVASSAVNRQILKLEDEIGAVLFERVPGGVRLTAAGEALARHVVVVLQDFERARGEIEGLKGARIGHVDIVTIEGLTRTFLPEALGQLHDRAPRITVSATTQGSDRIAAMVTGGQADMGIGFDIQRQPDLRQAAVARFRLGLVAAPGHPLAGRPWVTLNDCIGHRLILPDASLSIHRILRPLLADLPPGEGAFVTSSSVQLMYRMTLAGLGISFQTRLGLEPELARGELVHVPLMRQGEPMWSELGIYVRAGRSLAPSVDLTLRLMADHLVAVAREG